MFTGRIAITGATGFIGSFLASVLLERGVDVLSVGRRFPNWGGGKFSHVYWKAGNTRLSMDDLEGVLCVIHTAGLAHIISKSNKTSLVDQFHEINVKGTLELAKDAAASGVKRFVFVSTIGVNGVVTKSPFTEGDDVNPTTDYAQSKYDAEAGLWEIQRETGIEVVIIRPPMVYGAGAPGNFSSLVSFVRMGVPLPFASIKNLRSFVSVNNLVDLLIVCINHKQAANEIFLVSDGRDVSTPEFLAEVAEACGTRPYVFSFSVYLLRIIFSLLGRGDWSHSLIDSLQIDIYKARSVLEWEPPNCLYEELGRSINSGEN